MSLLRRRSVQVCLGFLIFAVAFVVWANRSYTPPIVDERGQPVAGAIASMEEIEINGTRHFFLIRGASKDLPVLLFVHGGLGSPYSAIAHTFQREWEKHFIVVHWDQRGSGKLYRETDPQRITVAQLLDDTRAVAQYLNQRFGRKVYLIGHSWGSYLAFRTAAKYPELFEAYIGVGQTVGILKEDQHSHQWVLQEAARRNDKNALSEMESIGPPPYADINRAYDIKYGLLGDYGGMLNHKDGMMLLPKAVFTAPEYSLFDGIRFVRGMNNYQTHLLGIAKEKTWQLSIEDIKQIDVPAYFIYGEHDQATPGSVLKEYVRTLRAPGKAVIKIDGAAHFPFIDRQAEFTRTLVGLVNPADAAPAK